MLLSSLPMYDLPELRTATDRFWAQVAQFLMKAAVEGVAEQLSRPGLGAFWQNPELLLSQTCGFPLVHELRGRVRYVATPHYRAPGCEGPSYRSFYVARKATLTSPEGASRVAINGYESQSGFNVLRYDLCRAGVQLNALEHHVTGSHRESLRCVKAGYADLASVDCVTHALIMRHAQQELDGLVVIGESTSAPSLPYITSLTGPAPEILRAALDAGISAAGSDLLIEGLSVLPDDAYDPIIDMANVSPS